MGYSGVKGVLTDKRLRKFQEITFFLSGNFIDSSIGWLYPLSIAKAFARIMASSRHVAVTRHP